MIDRSELSSISKTLEEVARRVAKMADEAHQQGDDGSATELYAIERGLVGATRRITRLTGGRS